MEDSQIQELYYMPRIYSLTFRQDSFFYEDTMNIKLNQKHISMTSNKVGWFLFPALRQVFPGATYFVFLY